MRRTVNFELRPCSCGSNFAPFRYFLAVDGNLPNGKGGSLEIYWACPALFKFSSCRPGLLTSAATLAWSGRKNYTTGIYVT
jgi:hypothetical protein